MPHFEELSPNLQQRILQEIRKRYTSRSTYNMDPLTTAYSLKQPVSRIVDTPDFHLTEDCFREAMRAAGFKEKADSSGKIHFNVYVLKQPRV